VSSEIQNHVSALEICAADVFHVEQMRCLGIYILRP